MNNTFISNNNSQLTNLSTAASQKVLGNNSLTQINNQDTNESEEKNIFSEKISKDKLTEKLEELNDTVNSIHKSLRFEIHDESQRTMVKVINIEKNEVIKEIPSKEILDMIGRIKEMVGLIIDEKI